jgi:hypothetical protein
MGQFTMGQRERAVAFGSAVYCGDSSHPALTGHPLSHRAGEGTNGVAGSPLVQEGRGVGGEGCS